MLKRIIHHTIIVIILCLSVACNKSEVKHTVKILYDGIPTDVLYGINKNDIIRLRIYQTYIADIHYPTIYYLYENEKEINWKIKDSKIYVNDNVAGIYLASKDDIPLLNEHNYVKIVLLRCIGSIDEEVIKTINQIQPPQLSLTLELFDGNDEELMKLQPLKEKVSVLSLRFSHLSDVSLKYIKKFNNLLYLDLSGINCTDLGLEIIKDLPNLKSLDLTDTKITDSSLKLLRNILNQFQQSQTYLIYIYVAEEYFLAN